MKRRKLLDRIASALIHANWPRAIGRYPLMRTAEPVPPDMQGSDPQEPGEDA